MTFEQPIRQPQRRQITPERLIERIDILLESASIVESSIRDLCAEVYIRRPSPGKNSIRHQSQPQTNCLFRASKTVG